MPSPGTCLRALSNFCETAEVRIVYPRVMPQSNYKLAHVFVSSRIYWKTMKENDVSKPMSLIDFRGCTSLELIRLGHGTWNEVDEAVKVEKSEGRTCITLTGRLHGASLRNDFLPGRDMKIQIVPSTPEQLDVWLNEIRMRIAPWNLVQQKIMDESSLTSSFGLKEFDEALGRLANRMFEMELSSIPTNQVEEQWNDNLGTLPEKIEKLSHADKLTAHGAAAVGSGATLAKFVASAEYVTETAELLASLSRCVAGASTIFQLVSLAAEGVSMCMEASRGRSVIPVELHQIAILLRYVLESLAKITRHTQRVNETCIDLVFNALKEILCVMKVAETQLLRGRISQIVNAADVKKVETKVAELRHMAVTVDNTARIADNTEMICDVSEKVNCIVVEDGIRRNCLHHVRPPTSAFFSGRRKELKTLKEKLEKWGSAVITQYGGVGKTELMLAFADRAEQEGQVPGGVFWITIDGDLRDAISSLAGLAEKLTRRKMGKDERRNANLVIESLKRGLGEKQGRWLLCMDNADNEEVNGILNELCGLAIPLQRNGWVVVTSRQGLPQIWERMKSDQKFVLGPLCEEDGMVILWRRSRVIDTVDADDEGVRRDMKKLEGENADEYCALKELCGDDGSFSLGGLPLALIQAGSFIRKFNCSFTKYLNLFRSTNKEDWEDLMDKTEKLKSIRESQRSIWTTWKISVGKLSVEAYKVLRAMALLGQGGIGEAVMNGILREVTADGGDNVEKMCRNILEKQLMHGSSLIWRDGEDREGKRIYGMHRLVRQYVLNDMAHGSYMWNNMYSIALLAVHRSVKAALEKEGNSFEELPDAFENNNRELVMQSLALVHHHVLPPGGNEIRDVSEVEDIHKYSGMALNFMGKSEEEVKIWEHFLDILRHQQADNRRRGCIGHLLDVLHRRNRGKKEKGRIISVNNALGRALMMAGQLGNAASILQQTLEMGRSIYGKCKPHRDVARSLNHLGAVYARMGELAKAQEKHEESLEMRRAIYGFDKPHIDVANSLNNLGIVFYEMSQLDEALEKYEKSLHMYRQIHGKENLHSDIADSLYNLGIVHLEMGKHEKALEKHQESLEIRRAIHGKSTPHCDIADSLYYLARSYAAIGERDNAVEKYEESIETRRAIQGHDKLDWNIANSLYYLGNLHSRMGELDKALEKQQECLKIRRAIQGDGKPSYVTAFSLWAIGLLHHKKMELSDAVDFLQQSLHMLRIVHGPHSQHPDILEVEDDLAKVYQSQKSQNEQIKKN